MNLRLFRIVAWTLAGLLTVAVVYVGLNREAGQKLVAATGGGIGGPFALTRSDGSQFTDRELAGSPYLVFFGFTHCPEVCPTTLWEASGWLKELGKDADRLKMVFVTVDPERDTSEVLAEYMTSFDPRIVALTGTPEAVEAIKKAYKVYSRKVPTEDGDYTVDHTASIYLMHGDGSFSGTIAYQESADTVLEKLRRLIANG